MKFDNEGVSCSSILYSTNSCWLNFNFCNIVNPDLIAMVSLDGWHKFVQSFNITFNQIISLIIKHVSHSQISLGFCLGHLRLWRLVRDVLLDYFVTVTVKHVDTCGHMLYSDSEKNVISEMKKLSLAVITNVSEPN